MERGKAMTLRSTWAYDGLFHGSLWGKTNHFRLREYTPNNITRIKSCTPPVVMPFELVVAATVAPHLHAIAEIDLVKCEWNEWIDADLSDETITHLISTYSPLLDDGYNDWIDERTHSFGENESRPTTYYELVIPYLFNNDTPEQLENPFELIFAATPSKRVYSSVDMHRRYSIFSVGNYKLMDESVFDILREHFADAEVFDVHEFEV
jgi:hypothetical protein